MDVLNLIYPKCEVKIYTNEESIVKIILNDEIIPFYWKSFKEYLINHGDNLRYSLIDTPYTRDNLVSNLSVTSLDITTNFIRGISVILVLQKLIVKEKYLQISSLPQDYSIFTRNNLRALRVAIIFHLKIVEEDKMLKHALDFINRWSCLFHLGDKIDKLELLTELIVKYLAKEREITTTSVDPNLTNRIRRIESILGINS